MNLFTKRIALLLSILVLIACNKETKIPVLSFGKTDLTAESIIPKPLETESTNQGFSLDKHTTISISEKTDDLIGLVGFLSEKIKSKTNLDISLADPEIFQKGTIIYIEKTNDLELKGEEAYELNINQDSLILSSSHASGLFRGLQTVRQIIPEKSNDTITTYKTWPIPTGKIKDKPQFEYRGFMLDVSRHFFSVEDVKKHIDLLAYYKYNYLHLHLSDDQGWRIEIKSWPLLTKVGGSTEVGGGSSGFYTQEDYVDIVNYAAKHHITIIPEIDMPGHTNAASVSYPKLNGNGKTPELYTGTRVGMSTLDTRKDEVYTFIDDVVKEISAITPGPYFHIGGDESHVTKKVDYNYFVEKVEKIVQQHGKQMIGWDEIATANISSSSISQFWRSKENVLLAVEKNMKIILSPAKKAYLDMKYDKESKYGLTWAGEIPVDTAYIWTPENYEEIPTKNILGIEAPLWSETITNLNELQYLAFPRAIGYAELGWSKRENRDWEDYKKRLANQTAFLNRMNVKYYPSSQIKWQK
ncbi:family 20 glycosylhydrolase [Algibacter aquimarinus]|uniref:beta-N-acetylhexosaminidase n=1 Tax=Algibacter aquimarinus TaxID=1136748 RepID=A0ABP9HDQ0_9FLAO